MFSHGNDANSSRFVGPFAEAFRDSENEGRKESQRENYDSLSPARRVQYARDTRFVGIFQRYQSRDFPRFPTG